MLPPIQPKKIAIIAAVLVAFTIASVLVNQWWTGRETATRTEIADLQRGISVRDLKIKGQDRVLAELKHRDSLIVDTIATRTAQLADAKEILGEAERAMDADAAAHEGLVPIAAVHDIELKADVAIKSCEGIDTAKDARIDELLAQIANQATTRADLDTNRTAEATILKDTVAVLKPPWIKRALGWIGDHAVTLATGIGIGVAGGIAITKK